MSGYGGVAKRWAQSGHSGLSAVQWNATYNRL
jgi:hypothetical protein